MKSVIFRIGGKATTGDVLVLNAVPSKGGLSYARYFPKGGGTYAYLDENDEAQRKVTEPETPAEMAVGLAVAINASGEFPSDHITATAKGDLLVLSCSDVYADVIFTGEVQGKRTETIEEI